MDNRFDDTVSVKRENTATGENEHLRIMREAFLILMDKKITNECKNLDNMFEKFFYDPKNDVSIAKEVIDEYSNGVFLARHAFMVPYDGV